MHVLVDDLIINYQRSGRGKVLVLLHGWGDRANGLRSLSSGLDKHYEVIALDLPGFGASDRPKTAWGLTDYAQLVGHFVQKIGIKKVYAYIGHSNGGAIAVRGLANGSLQSSKLILLASAGIRGEYKGRIKTLRYITKFGKTLTMPLPKSVKRTLRMQVYKTVGSDMLVAEHLQKTFKKIVSDDVRADAAKLTLPTLLIYGEKDVQTPIWFGETFRQIMSDATLVVLPEANHFLAQEQPAAILQYMMEFLT